MNPMQENVNLLGLRMKDKVTGAEGVVTSISFDISGCIQALLNLGKLPDGKMGDIFWVDTKRLEKISSSASLSGRAMDLPTFEVVPGPEAKPIK